MDTRRSLAWGVLILAGAAIGAARLTAEDVKTPEFCTPGESPPAAHPAKPKASLKAQPESTRRMAALLHEIARKDDPYQNPFKFPEMVNVLREKLKHPIAKDELPIIQLQFANTLLRAGNSAEALQEFEKYEAMMKAETAEWPPQVFTMVLTSKAMCLLRLGEEENCLYNHNSDSCLLPIRGGGIHQRQSGSRGAIGVLTELLQRYPGDLRWTPKTGQRRSLSSNPENDQRNVQEKSTEI